MLFDINTAIQVRNHYKDILTGKPLSNDSEWSISGIFVCHKEDIRRALDILENMNFDDKYPLVAVPDDRVSDFEVYVYTQAGADIYYDELDKNLTEKGIDKIYAPT